MSLVRPDRPADADLPVLDDFDELVTWILDSYRRYLTVTVQDLHGVRRTDVFLRYSKGPTADAEGGPSRDYESGVEMPGLSVTPVVPEPWWSRPAADWVARRICKYAALGSEQDRFPWLLTGRVVGNGPDHEPLVVDAMPIARVGRRALEQAERRYRERFEVGRDSRA